MTFFFECFVYRVTEYDSYKETFRDKLFSDKGYSEKVCTDYVFENCKTEGCCGLKY